MYGDRVKEYWRILVIAVCVDVNATNGLIGYLDYCADSSLGHVVDIFQRESLMIMGRTNKIY